MPKTVEVLLYEFDELSDKAKEKAREWWRECEASDFGSHGDLYEPAETAAKLMGITFKTHDVQLIGKDPATGKHRTRQEPNIFWALDVQGAGAAFEGRYEYAKGAAKNIAAEFPKDTKLQGIAMELQELQKRYRYSLCCQITTNGRDVHRNAMDIELDNYGDGVRETDFELLLEILRGFADWIYEGIREEYDYRMSDENVDDAIKCNEYTFRVDGERSDG